MSLLNMENIWRILKLHKIESSASDISDFICVICKNITIKPYNVPCGCRYCFDCIKDYLKDGERVCLGLSDCCKDILINLKENVFIDQAANRRISNLKVKCPIESCEFSQELSRIEEHMRSCDLKPVKCPYEAIGCNETKIGFNKLKEHFTEENYGHARLLMEVVDNCGNEIKVLKATFLESQHENTSLRDEIKLMKHNNDVTQKTIALLKKEVEEQKRKAEKDKEHLELLLSKYDGEWKEIKKSQVQITSRLGAMSLENSDSSKNSEDRTVTLLMPVEDKQICGEFVWRVAGWNNTLKEAENGFKTAIWSEPFYSHINGYKMCMEMHPNGSGMTKGDFLFLGICIMKGEFDDLLSWPFTHDVILALLDLDTGLAHTSKTVKHSVNGQPWNKPDNLKNKKTGFRKFIRLHEISANGALCRGDQICIRASVQLK